MPIDRGAALQLGLIVLAVPLQYLISAYMLPSTQESRSSSMKSIVNKLMAVKTDYLSLQSWKKWVSALLLKMQRQDQNLADDDDDLSGESPALEVIRYRDPKGHFAASTTPRSPRPANVKFRVGQVIKHKRWGYRGIIVGWDATAKAPDHWIQQMHPQDKQHWRHQPNYSILVDTRDRLTPQTTYVPQENIEVLTNVKVLHPQVDEYFEAFDGAQYLPRPWLKVVYPHD